MMPTMASLDAKGVVRPVSSGNANILVEAGKISKRIDVLVQIPVKIQIDPSEPMMMLGVTKGFKATVYDDRKKPMIAGKMRWTTSDPTIFSVDDRGNVKSLKEGEAHLTVFAAGIKSSTVITVKHEELQEDGELTQ